MNHIWRFTHNDRDVVNNVVNDVVNGAVVGAIVKDGAVVIIISSN